MVEYTAAYEEYFSLDIDTFFFINEFLMFNGDFCAAHRHVGTMPINGRMEFVGA